MGELEKQEHGGALYRPSKGETPNPSGRPKKWQSELIKDGYKKSEINDCYSGLLGQTEDKLIELRDDKSLDIMIRKTAKALLKEFEKGSLWNQEMIITRLHGQPKQEIETDIKITAFKVKFNDEAKDKEV